MLRISTHNLHVSMHTGLNWMIAMNYVKKIYFEKFPQYLETNGLGCKYTLYTTILCKVSVDNIEQYSFICILYRGCYFLFLSPSDRDVKLTKKTHLFITKQGKFNSNIRQIALNVSCECLIYYILVVHQLCCHCID